MKRNTLKKQRLAGALLALTLLAGGVLPAGAAPEGGQNGPPPAETDGLSVIVKEMSLAAVERAVRENNATVLSLKNTASSIDTVSQIADRYEAQSGALQMQIASYQSQIDSLDTAMAGLDPASGLYKTYAAQRNLLQGNLFALQQNLGAVPVMQQATASAIDDAVYELQRTADNVADQLSMGAQDMLIGIRTMQNAETALTRQLAQLDRQLAMMEVTQKLGTVSQYQMDATRNGRENLAVNLKTLGTQRENLAGSLALMCGFAADTLVAPSVLPVPADTDLGKMNYEEDLALAKQNSFTIWQKKCDLQDAQNRYDKEISGTAEAVEAAKGAMEAERQAVETLFLTTYQTVKDCRAALTAAQSAEQQAETDFATAELRYGRGMLSQLDYLKAQDTLAGARDTVDSAGLKLISAFNRYQWAKKGLVSSGA